MSLSTHLSHTPKLTYEDLMKDSAKVLLKSKQTTYTDLSSSTQLIMTSEKVIRLVKHNFPLLKPCCLFLISLFYSTVLEVMPSISCSITFSGTEMRLRPIVSPILLFAFLEDCSDIGFPLSLGISLFLCDISKMIESGSTVFCHLPQHLWVHSVGAHGFVPDHTLLN